MGTARPYIVRKGLVLQGDARSPDGAGRGVRRSLASMAARSIASLTLGFGLVSIPVKVYSATESSASIGFNLLTKDGSRVKQQYTR
jgi:hypothetical protein